MLLLGGKHRNDINVDDPRDLINLKYNSGELTTSGLVAS